MRYVMNLLHRVPLKEIELSRIILASPENDNYIQIDSKKSLKNSSHLQKKCKKLHEEARGQYAFCQYLLRIKVG